MILKNESVGAEMIEILQAIQDNYVPMVNQGNGKDKTKKVIQKIFLGGDNFDRGKGTQSTRCHVWWRFRI